MDHIADVNKMVFKVDDNQYLIVKAARELGASVLVLSKVGKGCPDLLIAYKGQLYLCEVKIDSKAKLTPRQTTFVENWHSPIYRLETVDHLLLMLGI